MQLHEELAAIFKGELDTQKETLQTYSHDASLFELIPKVVARPKDVLDIESVVKWVNTHKKDQPELSITPRSAGTDMSGGAVNDSIILDMTPHFNQIEKISRESARVQPGVYYRDFDVKTAGLGVMLPSYPASRDLCTLGGMVSNNSGGEKSLQYGKTDQFVTEISIVLSDGKEYVITPLTKDELVRKMAQNDFEGNLYKKTFEL